MVAYNDLIYVSLQNSNLNKTPDSEASWWQVYNHAGGISGPGSSTDNALVRWDDTDGDALQNSGVTLDDSDNITGVANFTASGITSLGVESAASSLTHADHSYTAGVQYGQYTPNEIYDSIFSGIDHWDTIFATLEIAAGSSIEHADALSGYVDNRSASGSGGTNGVALFGVAKASVDDDHVWGINTLLQDNVSRATHSGTGRKIIGAELDFNVMGTSTEVIGASVGGNSLAQPTTANGYICNVLGSGISWTTGFWSVDGAASNAFVAGASASSGTNIDSQKIQWIYLDGAGEQKIIQAYVDAYDGTGYLTIDGTGTTQILIEDADMQFSTGYGIAMGGVSVDDILVSSDSTSAADDCLVTAGYVGAHAGGTADSDESSDPLLRLTNYYDDANSVSFIMRKARGTEASPTAVQQYDVLGKMQALGYVNGAMRELASIQFLTIAAPSGNYCQSMMRIYANDGATGNEHVCDIRDDGLRMAAGKTIDCATAGAYLKPRRLSQSSEPTPESGELLLWRDSDDSKANLVVNDPDVGSTTIAALNQPQTFTAGQRGQVTTLTDGENISIDLDDSNNFEITLAGDRQLDNPSNAVAGQSGRILVNQDGVGSRTLSYDTNYVFEGGAAPTLTTDANAMDMLVYEVLSATEVLIHCVADIS
jgi:hypothetical protein